MIEFQDGPSRRCGPAHLYPAFATPISGLEPSESAGDGSDLAEAAHGDTLQYFHKCLTNSFRRQWNILESIGDKDSLNNKIIVVLFTIKLTVHSPPHCLHLYLALQACRRRTSHHQLCCHHWGFVIGRITMTRPCNQWPGGRYSQEAGPVCPCYQCPGAMWGWRVSGEVRCTPHWPLLSTDCWRLTAAEELLMAPHRKLACTSPWPRTLERWQGDTATSHLQPPLPILWLANVLFKWDCRDHVTICDYSAPPPPHPHCSLAPAP